MAARVSQPGILHLAFMISIFNCVMETQSKQKSIFMDNFFVHMACCGRCLLKSVFVTICVGDFGLLLEILGLY